MARLPRGEYSVWVFMPDKGDHFAVAQDVDLKTAVLMAERATVAPGNARRVIVVDGGDNTCFEWIRSEGITYPPQEGA